MNNSELKIFNYKNNEVRITIKDGERFWILKDLCEILGIINSKNVAARLDKEEKAEVCLMDISSNCVQQRRNFRLSMKRGLYKVIIRSDKPEAKKFMHWVIHEVLLSIRKHGAYITSEKMEELINDLDTWIKLIRTLQQERREKSIVNSED